MVLCIMSSVLIVSLVSCRTNSGLESGRAQLDVFISWWALEGFVILVPFRREWCNPAVP